jgi:hypothetical protein
MTFMSKPYAAAVCIALSHVKESWPAGLRSGVRAARASSPHARGEVR